MKRICSSLALTLLVTTKLFATNVLAQPPAPTVKITCTVNYDFVQSHARDSKIAPVISPQGDYFSGKDFFVTRRFIDLYPKKIVSSDSYKVTIDAAMHSFLSLACQENIAQVLSYIDTHEFDVMQNVFYLGERSNLLPAQATERKIGGWNLGSWSNRTDTRVD